MNVWFVARSQAMKRLVALVGRVAVSEANVLIVGETGTGKRLVAEALHDGSGRASRPMITTNAGYCAEACFARELFGSLDISPSGTRVGRGGAFEVADGGTLFLDEVANVPLRDQRALLSAIEQGEFTRVGDPQPRKADVRVFSATNADLAGETALGRFRRDLLLRLSTIEIQVPPLRARRDDIPELATQLLREHCLRRHRSLEGFEPSAASALLEHEWPGNVRELDYTIGCAVRIARKSLITVRDLKLRAWREHSPRFEDMNFADVERFLIRKALVRFDQQSSLAAQALGLSHRVFQRRRRRLGI